jgi:hypothetical protein
MFRYILTFVPEPATPIAGFNARSDALAYVASLEHGYGFVPDEDVTIHDTLTNQPLSYYEATKESDNV